MAKVVQHPQTHMTKAICICGNNFEVESTIEWEIKVETCPKCHQTYTWKKAKIVMKWRMEKYLEKQKRMEAMKKAA